METCFVGSTPLSRQKYLAKGIKQVLIFKVLIAQVHASLTSGRMWQGNDY
jgi:hypothetical protein